MKDKWNIQKEQQAQLAAKSAVGRINSFGPEKWNRPSRALSSRAISNYNNIPLFNSSDGHDNYVFSGDQENPAKPDIRKAVSPEEPEIDYEIIEPIENDNNNVKQDIPKTVSFEEPEIDYEIIEPIENNNNNVKKISLDSKYEDIEIIVKPRSFLLASVVPDENLKTKNAVESRDVQSIDKEKEFMNIDKMHDSETNNNSKQNPYVLTPTLKRSVLTIPINTIPSSDNYPDDAVTVNGSEKTDITTAESTVNLVDKQPSLYWKCKWLAWPSSLERGLSCVSLAACFGNVARLPAAVALHGGAPFLLVYLLLVIIIGIPLVFLELGIGQIVQQGVTRTWRAVPMFRGVAYVKLLANMILCIYYPLYIGLALFYLTWLAKGNIPFTECASAKMTKEGYRTVGISGEQCLDKTFLASPVNDSKWFGIYAAFLLGIWLVIMLCSFRRIKAYIRSMNCFFIPIFVCLVALLVKAVNYELEFDTLKYFYQNIDWSVLQRADVWYYATVQLFFSTHLGFGNVVTCAGKVYNKADPFWAATAYMIVNIVVGVLSVIICYILLGDIFQSNNTNKVIELYLFNAIYDHAVAHRNGSHPWTVIAYFIIFLSGFVSMLAAVFTILKAIRVETKNRCRWWHTSAIMSFVFFTLGVFTVLVQNFQLVHIFDHYVVGNLLLLSTILEVGAFAYCYGCSNIYIDFEFIVGRSLTVIWKILWYLAPALLSAIFIWALVTLRLTGLSNNDPIWVYAIGWTIIILCIIFIIAMAIYEVYIQVDYNFVQKCISALKPSRKWGPVDPMLRHGWIQWRNKAGTGDRDFTLKRRGTRDYTHSVKNRRDTTQSTNQRYVSTLNTTTNSDMATMPVMSSPSYASERLDGSTSMEMPPKRHTLEVVSITDTLERSDKPRIIQPNNYYTDNGYYTSQPVMNPGGLFSDTTTPNDSNSEGYGTIRNGPYLITNGEFDHVCWRRSSHEEATEL